MLAFTAPVADVFCFDFTVWDDGINKRRFAHTTVPADQRDFGLQHCSHRVNAFAFFDANGKNTVAHFLVEPLHPFKFSPVFFFVHIGFIEDNDGRYMIHFAGHQKTVNESLRCPRIFDGG